MKSPPGAKTATGGSDLEEKVSFSGKLVIFAFLLAQRRAGEQRSQLLARPQTAKTRLTSRIK